MPFRLILIYLCFSSFAFAQNSPQVDKVDPKVGRTEGNSKADLKMNNWLPFQDSLRSVVLSRKSPSPFIGSILEELYIWNLVKAEKDSIHFSLDFDLHALGCSAPDCYRTAVEFKIGFEDSLIWPSKVYMEVNDEGCFKTTFKSGEYILEEHSQNYIQYHCSSMNSYLIFSNNDAFQEKVFFIPDWKQELLNFRIFDEAFNYSKRNNIKTEYPFTISYLANLDYERLLQN